MFTLVVLLASLSAAPKKKAPPPPPPPVTSPTTKVIENVSDATLRMMAVANKVQVFRVSDAGGLRPDARVAIASDFVRGTAGKVLDEKSLAQLRSVLYDQKSYRFEHDASRCTFVPHLSFQFTNGLDSLEALISFSCNQVLFISGKAGGRWLPQGRFDVKPVRSKLVGLAKEMLPADAPTQNLKD